MALIFLIGIVVIIILGIKNNELTNKNFILQQENKKYNKYKFCPHCGKSLIYDNCNNHNLNNAINNNYIQVDNQNINYNNNVIKDQEIKKPEKEKTTTNSKEIKNSLILITGSILIILSSILFLVSTWYSIHNLIKTLVIFLVLIVFFISSHIADKYLNLKQTSKAFYYIALAYIPIALFSIAFFELFGKYLSLYGLGKYIYLSFSSLIVAIIYYRFSNKRNSKLLIISSYIFQLLTVIFTALIFKESFKLVIISLIIYNIIFTILYQNKKYYYNEQIHIIINTILISLLSIISIFIMLISLFNKYFDLLNIILNILLLINLYIYLIKNIKQNNIFNYIYPIIIINTFYNLSLLIDTDFIFKQLFTILAIIIICLYDVIKNDKLNLSSFIEISVIAIILYISSLICSVIELDLYLKGFIILIVYTLVSFLNYYTNEKNKLFNSYTFTIPLYLSIAGIVNNLELPLVLTGFSILVIVLISVILEKIEINIKNTLNILGNIFIWIFTIFLIFINDVDILSKLSFIFIYALFSLIYSHLNKKAIYRVVLYIYFNIFTFILMDYLNLDYFKYIIPFTTLIIYGIENYVYKEKELTSIKIYLTISFFLTFIILLFNNNIYSLLLLLITNMLFNNYIKDNKLPNELTYVTNLNMLPYIYGSKILLINNFNYMYLISLLFILNYLYKIYTDKDNKSISLYYIYSIIHILSIEESKYIGLFILLIGTYLIYNIKENDTKDIFKGICYTLLLVLYKFIINDLKINDFTVLNMGIYIVYLLVISRNILKKYIDDYKALEYISSSFIYFVTLFMYNSEFDGILFVLFIVIMVMICYMYKFGPLLIVSLIAIIINILLLTREFWLSIPWWIYILLIGTLLVTFAIYNEMKLKKDNDIKDKLKELKDDFDM